ncbi:hypothetical protein JZ751_003439 [Albula glossodonta]|uniref:Uncharacterized protein n=1 Tax=Albula glossodonta TaxID=121402 RepID=A0A8T2N9A4_9TELE|nr:hypothetical protein JZ751_003439 [Albula glossodonta]
MTASVWISPLAALDKEELQAKPSVERHCLSVCFVLIERDPGTARLGRNVTAGTGLFSGHLSAPCHSPPSNTPPSVHYGSAVPLLQDTGRKILGGGGVDAAVCGNPSEDIATSPPRCTKYQVPPPTLHPTPPPGPVMEEWAGLGDSVSLLAAHPQRGAFYLGQSEGADPWRHG